MRTFALILHDRGFIASRWRFAVRLLYQWGATPWPQTFGAMEFHSPIDKGVVNATADHTDLTIYRIGQIDTGYMALWSPENMILAQNKKKTFVALSGVMAKNIPMFCFTSSHNWGIILLLITCQNGTAKSSVNLTPGWSAAFEVNAP